MQVPALSAITLDHTSHNDVRKGGSSSSAFLARASGGVAERFFSSSQHDERYDQARDITEDRIGM
jgi:hypothetical protein